MPETAVDDTDFFSDLFTDDDDFNSPSGGSGFHSSIKLSVPTEDKPQQGLKNDSYDDVLDMDDSDTDIVLRFDGQGKDSSADITQIGIDEALGEDTLPHTAANGRAAGCTDFF